MRFTIYCIVGFMSLGVLGACGDDDNNSSSGSGGEGTTSSGVGGSDGGNGNSPVCARWLADRADLAEASWSGDINTCDAGTIDDLGRDNALRIMNLYRWMAELPAVTHEPVRNAKAQQCALIMDSNQEKGLSHTPGNDWACFSADGAEAAGKSNIATAPGVSAVDLYMTDPGNDTTLGHRRWILSNSLGPVGLGSTSEYSCMWVIGGGNDAGKSWVAYPPPGDVPIDIVHLFSWTTLDETGWSIQSDDIDLSTATVEITDGGTPMPVSVSVLLDGYGSDYAIRIVPDGWTSQAGHTYHIRVEGISVTIEYEVSFVSCL